jgi:hypothetical protein
MKRRAGWTWRGHAVRAGNASAAAAAIHALKGSAGYLSRSYTCTAVPPDGSPGVAGQLEASAVPAVAAGGAGRGRRRDLRSALADAVD